MARRQAWVRNALQSRHRRDEHRGLFKQVALNRGRPVAPANETSWAKQFQCSAPNRHRRVGLIWFAAMARRIGRTGMAIFEKICVASAFAGFLALVGLTVVLLVVTWRKGRLSWRPLLSVLCRRIYYTAVDRFCAPVAPAAQLKDYRCHCMPDIFSQSISLAGVPQTAFPASAGPRYIDAGRPGHVPDAGRVRRVRAMIRERVMGGLSRAKAEGIQLGRRRLEDTDPDKVTAILAGRAKGTGIRRIARDLGVGVGTVLKVTDKEERV
jgi:hypothetical protein